MRKLPFGAFAIGIGVIAVLVAGVVYISGPHGSV